MNIQIKRNKILSLGGVSIVTESKIVGNGVVSIYRISYNQITYFLIVFFLVQRVTNTLYRGS